METMNAFDIGQILAVIALFYKLSSDRAHHAEDMGRIKSQIEHLESRASTVDTRLGTIDAKLEKLMSSLARVEAILNRPQALPSDLI